MKFEGGCYCGAIRYEAEGDPIFRLQCHCRECQYISGGSPNVCDDDAGGRLPLHQGHAAAVHAQRSRDPVTREFCAICGTHLVSRSPKGAGAVIIKVGTMDNPALFEPDVAIFTVDKQPFHALPEGKPAFERLPG